MLYGEPPDLSDDLFACPNAVRVRGALRAESRGLCAAVTAVGLCAAGLADTLVTLAPCALLRSIGVIEKVANC
jgi:hypothetical protein